MKLTKAGRSTSTFLNGVHGFLRGRDPGLKEKKYYRRNPSHESRYTWGPPLLKLRTRGLGFQGALQ